MTAPDSVPTAFAWRSYFAAIPGIGLAAAVAAIAWLLAKAMPQALPIPAMVLALLVGMALGPIAKSPICGQGIRVCVRTILRGAIALLGLRIGLSDIVGLGAATVVLVILAMLATIVSGFLMARWHGQSREFGALVGVGTAVCGASATLATSTILRDYPGKEAEIAFVVVAVNAFATFALIAYPPLCVLLGFDQTTAGIMLGGTIHDVAQVAGAGYAMSETTGNAAVIVKLFRVFLLLPVVLCIGVYFQLVTGRDVAEPRVPVPVFAIVFLALSILNTFAQEMSALLPAFNAVRSILIDASSVGLLLAVSAIGLSTSVRQIASLGWRHLSTVCGATAVILIVVTGGLILLK